mmetsp:Transcript_82240/g.129462  ORF Transcript_82240/g.129462 Transcript_82240/m.129462 type:complete len:331 (+) Transcript_82240:1853-2845(+)
MPYNHWSSEHPRTNDIANRTLPPAPAPCASPLVGLLRGSTLWAMYRGTRSQLDAGSFAENICKSSASKTAVVNALALFAKTAFTATKSEAFSKHSPEDNSSRRLSLACHTTPNAPRPMTLSKRKIRLPTEISLPVPSLAFGGASDETAPPFAEPRPSMGAVAFSAVLLSFSCSPSCAANCEAATVANAARPGEGIFPLPGGVRLTAAGEVGGGNFRLEASGVPKPDPPFFCLPPLPPLLLLLKLASPALPAVLPRSSVLSSGCTSSDDFTSLTDVSLKVLMVLSAHSSKAFASASNFSPSSNGSPFAINVIGVTVAEPDLSPFLWLLRSP